MKAYSGRSKKFYLVSAKGWARRVDRDTWKRGGK